LSDSAGSEFLGNKKKKKIPKILKLPLDYYIDFIMEYKIKGEEEMTQVLFYVQVHWHYEGFVRLENR
jgi:hypothetical protein